MRLFKMAELFAVSKPNISMLIAKIFAENELDDSVVKSYLTTAAEGKRYNVIYYALGVTLPSKPPRWRLSIGEGRNLLRPTREGQRGMQSQQVATLLAGGFRRVRLFRTVIARE